MTARSTAVEPVLLTPTFGPDLARFAFLRESLDTLGVPFHHIAVVPPADVAACRAAIGTSRVEILSTADVLPRALERRRRNYRRRDLRHWFLPSHVHGWTIQQLIKLVVAAELNQSVLCLDSDGFLLRPLDAASLRSPDGRPLVFESVISDRFAHDEATKAVAAVASCSDQGFADFVQAPAQLHGPVVRRALDHLARRHGTVWWQAFLDLGLSEYQFYGHYVRYVDGNRSVTPARPIGVVQRPTDERDPSEFVRHVVATGEPTFAVIQSTKRLDVAAYEATVRELWKQVAIDG